MTSYDIRRYGAVGDGTTNDAKAIQEAIDACAAAGGGTVLVPAGAVYMTGSIVLKDFVELHVERGATLAGSANPDDYTERRDVTALSGGILQDWAGQSLVLIAAHGARNIAITGAGTIDGAGRHFIEEDLGYIYRCPVARPFTVFLTGCIGVTIREVNLRDPALWCLRLTGCEDVLITGITIKSDLKHPNADGIDLDRSKRVRISDCEISCGDDAISLKTCDEFPEYGTTEDVVITNCTLQSTSSGVVVGVDCVADIRNVIVSNCVIRSSHRGLSVSLAQEGNFENILFTDCIVETRLFDTGWWGRGEPIVVKAFPWHDRVGTIRNVRFRNILARSENGAYIAAERPGLISGVVLEGVRIELARWSKWPGGELDRRPYGQGQEIVAHPTSGVHIDTASDVTLRDCEIVWGDRPDHFAHAVEAIRADGLVIEGLRGEAAHPDRYEAVRRA
ncbi:glycoside hydrolase family 28 protein [Nonomuraea angiospora]|uniref:glycoside hydrolase family 28 protein n=1 Tax=Nonomuraea angiospora TaxID=46172 RepID=UPI00344720EE